MLAEMPRDTYGYEHGMLRLTQPVYYYEDLTGSKFTRIEKLHSYDASITSGTNEGTRKNQEVEWKYKRNGRKVEAVA